jgi:predicted ABC-type sugar transport system permease subunit
MSQRGQASVEFVALLPLLAVLAAGMLQVVLAGGAAWSASQAAASAARAAAVGGDARAAARRSLPGHLSRGMRVESGDGRAAVVVRLPSLIGAIDLGTVTGRARFAPQS